MRTASRSRALTIVLSIVLAGAVSGCALRQPPNYRSGATGEWWEAHHEAVYKLMIDADAVAHPMADVPGYAGKCQTLEASVKRMRSIPKIPSKKLDFAMERALKLFERSVKQCAASFSQGVSLNSIDQATTARLSAMNNASFGQVRLRTILSAFGHSVNGLPTLDADKSASTTTVAVRPSSPTGSTPTPPASTP